MLACTINTAKYRSENFLIFLMAREFNQFSQEQSMLSTFTSFGSTIVT